MSDPRTADAVGPEDAAAFPPGLDDMERLWTPHRMVYIRGEKKPKDATENACPFCAAATAGGAEGASAGDDETHLVVARGRTALVILNLFPYNPGHLMVVPYRHVSGYVDLTPDETVEEGEDADQDAAEQHVARRQQPQGQTHGDQRAGRRGGRAHRGRGARPGPGLR